MYFPLSLAPFCPLWQIFTETLVIRAISTLDRLIFMGHINGNFSINIIMRIVTSLCDYEVDTQNPLFCNQVIRETWHFFFFLTNLNSIVSLINTWWQKFYKQIPWNCLDNAVLKIPYKSPFLRVGIVLLVYVKCWFKSRIGL